MENINKNFKKLFLENEDFNNNEEVRTPAISSEDIYEEGYEKSRLLNIDDIKTEYQAHFYKDLSKMDVDGSLVSTYFDEETKKLKLVMLPKSHKLITGTTGSGKTQSYILPYIKVVSSLKNPHSFCITDPKGEIYIKTASELKEKGYKVYTLNFRDALYSDSWNPLSKIYDINQRILKINSEIKLCSGDPKESTKKQIGFKNKSYKNWYLFDEIAYASKENVEAAVLVKRETLKKEIDKEIATISYTIVDTSENTKDPYWENSARELFMAIIYRLLELSENFDGITREQFNLKTVVDIASLYKDTDLQEFFEDSKPSSMARKLANNIVWMSAQVTKSCIISTLSTKVAPYKSYTAQKVTITNSIELGKLDDQPTAIFMIIDDMDKANYAIAQLVISSIYEELTAISNRNPNLILSRTFEFILDEFGNIPKFENFANMISTSRSRDIWFTIVLQAYSQLDHKYGENVRNTILNNINMEIFFGTNDHETKEIFSKKCGQNTRVSPTSYYNAKDENIEYYDKDVYQIVPVSDLSIIKADECYIRYMGQPILHSTLVRFYKIDEFNVSENSSFDSLYSPIAIDSGKYTYSYLKKNRYSENFKVIVPSDGSTDKAGNDKPKKPRIKSDVFDFDNVTETEEDIDTSINIPKMIEEDMENASKAYYSIRTDFDEENYISFPKFDDLEVGPFDDEYSYEDLFFEYIVSQVSEETWKEDLNRVFKQKRDAVLSSLIVPSNIKKAYDLVAFDVKNTLERGSYVWEVAKQNATNFFENEDALIKKINLPYLEETEFSEERINKAFVRNALSAKTKASYIESFEIQLKVLAALNVFPKCIMICLGKAFQSFKSYTLAKINEIKNSDEE